MAAVVKPDNTVLVHDGEGYQSVAWLTWVDSVSTTSGPPEEFTLVAHKDGMTPQLTAHERDGFGQYPVLAARRPVGRCPDAGVTSRPSGGLLEGCEHYSDCDIGFVVPAGVLDRECNCGLPTFETNGGRRCLDSTCERVAASSAGDD